MNQVEDRYSRSHGRRLFSEKPLEDNQVGYFMVASAVSKGSQHQIKTQSLMKREFVRCPDTHFDAVPLRYTDLLKLT